MSSSSPPDKSHLEQISDLQTRISLYELNSQKLRDTQSRLDLQIDIFNRIHRFNQLAFAVHSPEELYALIVEGIIDIFQVEIAALFSISSSGEALLLESSCNMDNVPDKVELPTGWLAHSTFWNMEQQQAFWESPVSDAPWNRLGLEHAIYMPFYNNDRKLSALILGGISKEQRIFYDFNPQDLLSSFLVYGQQMNGILNNLFAIQRAQEAEKAKTQFLSNLSHEIRTPMNAIIGMVQIAERSADENEWRRCIRQISTSSRHLLGLINDVLDISKIEEGKLALNRENFVLKETIDDLLSSILPHVQAREQDLQVHYHRLEHEYLVGDALRLAQVLINLLSNATKFTPIMGHIELHIEEISHDSEHALFRFEVRDTGIGIGENFQSQLFKPFEQGDNSISRHYGGTGLGLAISQRIVELMGGRIEVQSSLGKGSSFFFTIWMDVDGTAVPQEAVMTTIREEDCDFSSYRLLVVDDVEINRLIVESFLAETGAYIDFADNGQEAVDRIANSLPYQYNLILMDMQMPLMDGCTATRVIRALERPDAAKIIILAMTANVFREDIQQAIEAGMNGHIGKPLERDKLLAMLQQMLSQQEHQGYDAKHRKRRYDPARDRIRLFRS